MGQLQKQGESSGSSVVSVVEPGFLLKFGERFRDAVRSLRTGSSWSVELESPHDIPLSKTCRELAIVANQLLRREGRPLQVSDNGVTMRRLTESKATRQRFLVTLTLVAA